MSDIPRVDLDDLISFGKVVARFGPDRPLDPNDPLWTETEAEIKNKLPEGHPDFELTMARFELARAWCRPQRRTDTLK